MSDTKALLKYVRDRLNDGPNITFGKPTVCDLVEALDSAEANVARLNKMVDWLANKLIYCPPEFTNCAEDCAECRKEAARRAAESVDFDAKAHAEAVREAYTALTPDTSTPNVNGTATEAAGTDWDARTLAVLTRTNEEA